MIIAEFRLETHTDRGKETLTFEPNKFFGLRKVRNVIMLVGLFKNPQDD
jgi:hypothetical protein